MSIKKFTKRSRFNNTKVIVDDIKFDSKSEAHYYRLLKELQMRKRIAGFARQVKYPLPNMEGQMKMSYIADFVVEGMSGTEYIIDVKGLLTPEMKVKMAFCQYFHKIKIHIVFSTGIEAFRTDFLI